MKQSGERVLRAPCLWQISAVFGPALCSPRIATICFSMCLDRFIVRPFPQGRTPRLYRRPKCRPRWRGGDGREIWHLGASKHPLHVHPRHAVTPVPRSFLSRRCRSPSSPLTTTRISLRLWRASSRAGSARPPTCSTPSTSSRRSSGIRGTLLRFGSWSLAALARFASCRVHAYFQSVKIDAAQLVA